METEASVCQVDTRRWNGCNVFVRNPARGPDARACLQNTDQGAVVLLELSAFGYCGTGLKPFVKAKRTYAAVW